MELSIRKKIAFVAIATASLLMVPFLAMQFTSEVNWSFSDFFIMGALLFSTGLAYVLITRMSNNTAYRVGVGLAVVTGFLLIWVNLAVGVIGSEDNPANLMYIGVLQVGVIGVALARFKPRFMAYAAYATAFAQALVPVIAFFVWRPSMQEPPGMVGVFMLNGFFVTLFVVAGALFAHAGEAMQERKQA